MIDKLKLVQQKIDQMTFRERMLILIACLVAIHQAWDSLVWIPMVNQQEAMYAQEEEIANELQSIQATLSSLSSKAQADPNKSLKQQSDAIDDQIKTVEAYIENETASLIKPPEMAKLLAEIFKSQEGLQLVSLDKARATPLLAPELDPATKEPLPVKYQIYRHDFTIQFRGSYMATLAYMKALESIDGQFFWGAVEYSSDEFPKGLVTINLYTLSLNEGWIGV
jgi:MSHA biogenesis protein MshJ